MGLEAGAKIRLVRICIVRVNHFLRAIGVVFIAGMGAGVMHAGSLLFDRRLDVFLWGPTGL